VGQRRGARRPAQGASSVSVGGRGGGRAGQGGRIGVVASGGVGWGCRRAGARMSLAKPLGPMGLDVGAGAVGIEVAVGIEAAAGIVAAVVGGVARAGAAAAGEDGGECGWRR
jgi:hypothetical protein